jgi:hypothetical protein
VSEPVVTPAELGSVEERGRGEALRLAAARTLERAAGGLARAAAEDRSPRRTAVARRSAERLDVMAAYLRRREAEEIVADVEAAIRRHPMRALAVAFISGYLARRVTRGLTRSGRSRGGSHD